MLYTSGSGDFTKWSHGSNCGNGCHLLLVDREIAVKKTTEIRLYVCKSEPVRLLMFWFVCFVASLKLLLYNLAAEKWRTTQVWAWWWFSYISALLQTCLLLLYTIHIMLSINTMHCCYCWHNPCTPCCPLQNNQKIPCSCWLHPWGSATAFVEW